MADVPAPQDFLFAGAGGLMLFLALVVMIFDSRKGVGRALALFLTMRGALIVTAVIGALAGPGTVADRVEPYFHIAVPFAALYLGWSYHRAFTKKAQDGSSRRALSATAVGSILLLLGLAFEALYFADHGLWMRAGLAGPLRIFIQLKPVAYAGLAALLARDYAAAAAGPRRKALYLGALAFALDPAFVAVRLALGAGAFLAAGSSSQLSDPIFLAGRALDAVTVLGLGLLAWALARWARARPRDDRPAGRRFLFALAVAGGSATFAALVATAGPAAGPLDIALDGAWSLALPLLLTYAILKHRLFGVELVVKRTLRQSGVVTAFALLLLGTSQAAQFVLSREASLGLGLAATAGLGLAFSRVGRAADRVADLAMPGVAKTPEYLHRRRAEVYRAALEQALDEQGRLPESEVQFLAALRTRLDIGEEEHHRWLAAARRGERPGLDVEPGALALGRYRVERLLGRGSSGEVFLARDEQEGQRQVVLKRLLALRRQDPRALRRFRKEADLAASLRHPRVVAVLDVAAMGPETILVMEYVPGGSLADRVARGPLHESEAVRVGLDLLEGLAALHARGIVHRDVKPANVLLEASGRAKLADFTIAREESGGDTLAPGEASGPVGTPAYMAPEQATGLGATSRSDLYALAATLYEAVSGRPPHDLAGLSHFEACLRVAQATPPGPIPGVSAALQALLLRGLARNPADRFPDAAEMAAALRRVGTEFSGEVAFEPAAGFSGSPAPGG